MGCADACIIPVLCMGLGWCRHRAVHMPAQIHGACKDKYSQYPPRKFNCYNWRQHSHAKLVPHSQVTANIKLQWCGWPFRWLPKQACQRHTHTNRIFTRAVTTKGADSQVPIIFSLAWLSDILPSCSLVSSGNACSRCWALWLKYFSNLSLASITQSSQVLGLPCASLLTCMAPSSIWPCSRLWKQRWIFKWCTNKSPAWAGGATDFLWARKTDGNHGNDSLKWNWTKDVKITFFVKFLSQFLAKTCQNL